LWIIVAKSSRNLVADALIYDMLMMTGFFLGLFYLGDMKNFTSVQIAGFLMAISGIVLMKIGF
jgi:hypothetical protein